MSGPITCGYLITHALLLLSARAIKEARAMKQEYGQVLAQLRDRELAVAQARQGQRAARLERIAAVRQEGAAADGTPGTAAIARSIAGNADAGACAEDLRSGASGADRRRRRGLERASARARHFRARAGDCCWGKRAGAFGAQVRATLATASATPTIDDVLSGYVLQRQLKPGLDPTQAERFRETAARCVVAG
jgi:hypothetical protein